MSFGGKRVLTLESRRAVETAELIRRNQGEPIVAPSMREAPLEKNEVAFAFAERLLKAEFDMVIFLTGVGTRMLAATVATRWDTEQIAEALRRTVVVARGPKPTAVLRELGVPPAIIAPEPNTWREVVNSIAGRAERSIAVQEYGRPATELHDVLRASGAAVTPVPVYGYELPEDLQPLRNAVEALAAKQVDVTLFTTGTQLVHLLDVARNMGRERDVLDGLQHSVIGSIGPTTTETLNDFGLAPDLEPSHPKLGLLVKETAERTAEVLCRKNPD